MRYIEEIWNHDFIYIYMKEWAALDKIGALRL